MFVDKSWLDTVAKPSEKSSLTREVQGFLIKPSNIPAHLPMKFSTQNDLIHLNKTHLTSDNFGCYIFLISMNPILFVMNTSNKDRSRNWLLDGNMKYCYALTISKNRSPYVCGHHFRHVGWNLWIRGNVHFHLWTNISFPLFHGV